MGKTSANENENVPFPKERTMNYVNLCVVITLFTREDHLSSPERLDLSIFTAFLCHGLIYLHSNYNRNKRLM